ncbi:glutamate receptor ionotropic, kainate 4 [Caerostris extrusa]|uniref:Glutamate receptor ionotropic, kainate 4 n=1 Tax=Caerostris extrusa TaxID=172846 RepID=A0AAV4WGU0_CAEEX|nr:glutamate receptor ionotropic, kainate 4 [Caerostris extrusa]
MKFPAFIKIAVNRLIGICHLEIDFEGKYVLADGSNAEFLQILSEALKFEYELFVPEDKEWGFKELNGTWNGLVGMVHRQEVDMAMCGIMLTEERQFVVNFGQSYDVAQNVIALKAPGLSPKPLAYVYPFTPAICFRDYILLASWIIAMFFLSRFYISVLLSFLTLPLRETNIRTISQLSKAVSAGDYQCFTYKGGIIHEIFRQSRQPDARFIGNAIIQNNWFVNPSIEDVKKIILGGNVAVLAMKDLIDGYFSGDVEALDDYVYTYPVGIMIRKNFCCRKSIDRKLRRIVESGLYCKSKNHYYFRTFLKDKKYEKERLKATQENYNPLSVVDLSGAFCSLL